MSPHIQRSPARRPGTPALPFPSRPRSSLGPGLLLGLVLATHAVSAAAQPASPERTVAMAPGLEPQPAASLAGKWRAEPMTVRWVIGNWGEACGPRPSGGGDPGGVVTVEEQGEELVIAGEGSRFSTEQCWQMHPALSRQNHSAGERNWKTTCRSAPKDARQEILQTTVSVNADVISLQESGQYQFVVQGQTCSASSGRWRTYRRMAEAPSAPPVAAAPPPSVRQRCADPGPPARMEVRPSRKLMRAGDTFHFRVSVFDAQGCSLGTPVVWQLSPAGSDASIDAGRLTVSRGAADAQLSVTASAASQVVRVAVDVVSDGRYAALLASGDFDADGASSEAATATITAGSLGARAGASSAAPSDRKWAFVVIVGGIALLFAALGAWLLRRGRRAPRFPARSRPLPDTGTVVFTGDDAIGDFPRRLDATRLEPRAAAAPKPTTVCPVCGTMYDTPGARTCARDGAQLLPINA